MSLVRAVCALLLCLSPVAALAQLPVIKANAVVEAIYYVLAGLGWLILAMPLVKWMVVDKRADPK